MNVEEKRAEQKNAKLILAKLHLICKRKFRNFNFEFRIFNYGSYSLSFISQVIHFFGSFTIFNSTFFKNLKTILLLNLFEQNNNPVKKCVWCKRYVIKRKIYTRLFRLMKLFYSYNRCFAIELQALRVNNSKLYHSCRYCSCLTHFGQFSLFITLKNIEKSVVFWCFQGV